MNQTIQRLSVESGFNNFLGSSVDTKLLCLQRFLRLFAYGSTFIALVKFLSLVGNSDAQIGLFLSLSLLGDVLISFVLTLFTDQLGRKRVLAAGCALMMLSGAAFAISSNYWLLLLAATVGVISPSGNEIGPFRAVEESILAQLNQEDSYSDMFAWYNMCGTGGAALGALSGGSIIQFFQSFLAWSPTAAYRTPFLLYTLLGAMKLYSVLSLSKAVEKQPQPSYLATEAGVDSENISYTGREGHPLLPEDEELVEGEEENGETSQPTPPTQHSPSTIAARIRVLLPQIPQASLKPMLTLLCLFALDSFASGLASPSWLTYFFTTYHSLSPAYLGTLFLVTNIIATLSNLAALPIARRLGPLCTMVFTHLPSAILLALIPVPGASIGGTWTAICLLILRACTQSMDQAPRQAFIAMMVEPASRTAVLGTVNMAKTLAVAVGTGLAGVLAEQRWWLVIFGGAGISKATYDLLLLRLFYTSKKG